MNASPCQTMGITSRRPISGVDFSFGLVSDQSALKTGFHLVSPGRFGCLVRKEQPHSCETVRQGILSMNEVFYEMMSQPWSY